MRRLLVASALFAALFGCDDASDETKVEMGAVLDEDAATVLPTVQVSNVGAACEGDQTCEGVAAQCLVRSSTATAYPGGYCTASCATEAECGPEGLCPVGEAERVDPRYDFLASWPRKCFQRCTMGAASGCRAGYQCRSLADAYWRSNAPAPMQIPVCIPMAPSADAGGELGTHTDKRAPP